MNPKSAAALAWFAAIVAFVSLVVMSPSAQFMLACSAFLPLALTRKWFHGVIAVLKPVPATYARSPRANRFSASACMPRQPCRQFRYLHHGSQCRIDRCGIGKRPGEIRLDQHKVRPLGFQPARVAAMLRRGKIKFIFRAQIIAFDFRYDWFFRLHSVFSLSVSPLGH